MIGPSPQPNARKHPSPAHQACDTGALPLSLLLEHDALTGQPPLLVAHLARKGAEGVLGAAQRRCGTQRRHARV